MHQVLSVEEGSIAQRYGLAPGDLIVSINGEPLIDEVDYQALTAQRHLKLRVIRSGGEEIEVDILKPDYAPLGLYFENTLVCDPRTCSNHCLFCFVDQMPEGLRQSLYVKDDDWRLSLMMGNFVTLTNVNDKEFERIIRRRAQPLYVSVHVTDPEVRVQMLRQPRAALIMKRLQRLKDEDLSFHCQIVLVPGMNDGQVLRNTLDDILSLTPAALSVALVPVGLTKFRTGLTDITPYDERSAREVLAICREYQDKFLAAIGKRFVYPADELICIAGAELPSDESYEGYPQIENGIGMIRLMDEELSEAMEEAPTAVKPDGYPHVVLACGTSIAPYLKDWVRRAAPEGPSVEVRPIINRFFGDTVTVSGLIVGADLAEQLSGCAADLILIPQSMLNIEQSHFLDNMTIADVEQRLGLPLRVVACTGEALVKALRDPRALIAPGQAVEGDPHDTL